MPVKCDFAVSPVQGDQLNFHHNINSSNNARYKTALQLPIGHNRPNKQSHPTLNDICNRQFDKAILKRIDVLTPNYGYGAQNAPIRYNHYDTVPTGAFPNRQNCQYFESGSPDEFSASQESLFFKERRPQHEKQEIAKDGWIAMDCSPSATNPYQSADVSNDSECLLPAHPNTYPVQIEDHCSKSCTYERQHAKSGTKIRQVSRDGDIQHIKYYEKHLFRVCHCGKANDTSKMLLERDTNDLEGYEVHYSQKCRWKAYDDFKTGKRVLIRLCKCYRPVFA